MHRIDDASAVSTLPATLQQGAPGYFRDGNPTIGEEATIVRADWANATQEEICYVIESAGITLSKLDRTQLAQAIARLTRLRLTSPITFYVSTTGNDSNDGLTPSTPFRSATHAYNYIRDRLDLNGFQATIQLEDGTYYGSIVCQFPCVGPPVIIQGNQNNPSAVVLSGQNVSCVYVSNGATIFIKSLTGTSTGSGQPGDYVDAGGAVLVAGQGGYIYFTNVRFGVCSWVHIFAGQAGVVTTPAPNIVIDIFGSAPCFAAGNNGTVCFADAQVTLEAGLAFEQFVDAGVAGSVQCWGCTFTGTCTGQRYYAYGNGIIATHGAGQNYLPGNAAGVLTGGGQYI